MLYYALFGRYVNLAASKLCLDSNALFICISQIFGMSRSKDKLQSWINTIHTAQRNTNDYDMETYFVSSN